jgi:peroxiredoxin
MVATVADFELATTEGELLQLSDLLDAHAAVVIYFTMWCPVCDAHMSDLRSRIVPQFPELAFVLVDYVSGSLAQARQAQLSNGYADMLVVADPDHRLTTLFSGTMGTTVIIGAGFRLLFNEDYRNGSRLQSVLDNLEPESTP